VDLMDIREIKKFEKIFSYCGQLWTSLVLRTMLVKTKENSWQIYYREAMFGREPKEQSHDAASSFKSHYVKVHETVHRIDSFEEVWSLIVGETRVVEEKWLEGTIKFGSFTVEHKTFPQLIDQTPQRPKILKGYIPERSFNPIPIVKELNWPALGIDLCMKNKSRDTSINRDAIEKNLRLHPSTPFMSLEKVANCYMDTFPMATHYSSRQNTIFCIFAPIYCRVEEIALSRKEVKIKLRVHKDLMKDISIALMPTSLNGRAMRGSRLVEKDFKIADQADKDLLLQAVYMFDEEVSYLRILPSTKDVQIPTSIDLLFSESIPNLRAKVHQHWDPKNELLICFLKGEGKNPSDVFERAVEIVLHIAGYLTENLGQLKGLSSPHGEVDIFAFSPDRNRIYAVECTTGPIGGKVAKIEGRVARLRAEIKKCHITSVIATSMIESAIPRPTLEEIGKKGILVLHRDLLVKMLVETQGDIQFVDFLENIARENHLKYMAR